MNVVRDAEKSRVSARIGRSRLVGTFLAAVVLAAGGAGLLGNTNSAAADTASRTTSVVTTQYPSVSTSLPSANLRGSVIADHRVLPTVTVQVDAAPTDGADEETCEIYSNLINLKIEGVGKVLSEYDYAAAEILQESVMNSIDDAMNEGCIIIF